MAQSTAATDPSAQIGNAQPYSYAQDLLFVSAQSAAPDVSAPLASQADAALAKLTAILAEAGASAADVVKIGVFYHQSVLDQEPQLLQRIRRAFPADSAPVVTAIPLHYLPRGELVQIEAIALRPGSKRSQARKAVAAAPFADGSAGFSRTVRCDDLVFVSGQMSCDAEGRTLHPENIVAQAKATIGNIGSALAEVGADLSSVVKLNTYYVGFGTTEDWSMAARVRSDAFRKPGPGATGVPVPGPYPAGLLLRQEAIGMVNPDGSAAHRDTSWPEGVWDWPIPVSFEQGLKINDLIVLGGQIAATTKGEAVFPGELAAQARNIMETISTILGGFDASCDDLAKVTILYATKGDPADIETILREVKPFFSKGLPALTFVPLARLGLSDLEIEIEGIGTK